MKNNWKYRIRCKLTRGAPVFEMLRRENEKKYKQIRFGVLCGTIVIIPAEAKDALEQEIGTSGKVTFSRIGNLSETDYLKVTAVGNAHFLTGAVTAVFQKAICRF